MMIGLGDDMSAPAQSLATAGTAAPPSPCLPAEGCFPSWCNWVPFADYFAACQPPTQAEMDAAAQAAITKAATATTGPDTGTVNQELADAQYAAYKGDTAALCRLDPVGCAAFKNATESPTCSKLLGPNNPLCGPNGSNYLLVGAAVLGALIYLGARR